MEMEFDFQIEEIEPGESDTADSFINESREADQIARVFKILTPIETDEEDLAITVGLRTEDEDVSPDNWEGFHLSGPGNFTSEDMMENMGELEFLSADLFLQAIEAAREEI